VGRRIARLRGIAVVAAMTVLLVPVSASAVFGGHKDGGGHPNVGLVAALSAQGALLDACTGTLVAPKVVLTSAHCVGGKQLGLVDHYVVTFKPVALRNGVVDGAIGGRPYPNPRFNLRFDQSKSGTAAFYRNSQYDVGVLVLDRKAKDSYPGIEPATLPWSGALDVYRAATTKPNFTHVGYGVTRSGVFDGIRRTRTSPLVKLTDSLLFTKGGICSGDSGGPIFDPRGFVAAVASFVDGTCDDAAAGPRLDIELTRSFLRKYGVN